MPKQGKQTMDRFWSKVDKSGDCWLWMSSLKPDGYGEFWFNGKIILAHRMAYELEVGSIPDGLLVCHACDVHRCVRPDHLFVGSQAENMADMASKGRAAVGEKHARTTLCDVDVLLIRSIEGPSSRAIASWFGVGKSTINNIRNCQSWAHL